MKKILIIFFCLILTFVLFHNFFIHKIFQFYLEKITEKNVKIENININLVDKTIFIKNIQILNNPKFQYKNTFYCNEIIIYFNYLNFFKQTILIDEIKFKNPIVYLEIIKKKNSLIFEDNISVLEKKEDTYKPKVYPQKVKDRDIIFNSVKIIDPKANIIISNNYRYENINISNMSFKNVGTSSSKSQHFKDIFKIFMSNIYFKIPDFEVQKKLKEIYMTK